MRYAPASVHIWCHKENGDLVLASPRWEPLTIDFDESLFKEMAPELMAEVGDRRIARGVLCQVGWLIENGHGVWFGIDLRANEQFVDLGEA